MASDFEISVMQELSEIKSIATAAATSAESAKDASVAATQAISDRLFHPKSGVVANLQSDIDEIKHDRERDEKWDRIHNVLHYSLTPLVVLAHSIARHFGTEI